MKHSKKKLVFKNKKKGKTYKNKSKKKGKTYKKRRYKRKTIKKKLIGGVNINLSKNDDSPQNIHIIANIGGTPMEITKNIETIFKEVGFDEDDNDPNPPNFLQLQNAFKTGLEYSNIRLTSDQIDKLKIKVWARADSKPDKLVYTTGRETTQGERPLEADTSYVIHPDEDEDNIAAAITDPLEGILFGMTASEMYNQRVDEWRGSMNPSQSEHRIEAAKVVAQKIKINKIHERIKKLKKGLDKIPERDTRLRKSIEDQLVDLEMDADMERLELPEEEQNTPVLLKKSSSNASYDHRGAAEEHTN